MNSSLPGSSRRAFLQAAAALPLAHAANAGSEEILPGLSLIRGAVNTARFERHGKTLLIDSGDLTAPPAEWVLFTHYHRDQASGASRLVAAGTKAAVPAAERRLFEGAREFWDSAEAILYHRAKRFRPSLFAVRDPVPAARAMQGGDIFEWEGLRFEALDTPGHTDGSLTYLVETGGKRVAFTGDLICGPGRIWEVYSLQKLIPGLPAAYEGFGGAVGDVKASLDLVLQRKPDLVVPSHGVIVRDPPAAVAELKKNLDAVMNNFLTTADWRVNRRGVYPPDKAPAMLPALPPVAYPKWFRDIRFTSKAIVADDTSIFLSDCGNAAVIDRLAQLLAAREIGPIEGIWITHYHDDHTAFINAAQQRFGGRIHVQRELVNIIEHPAAYNMPCLVAEPIRVDRIMEHGETIEWKEFRLTAYYFPGQTLYHAGLLVERDGFKLFLSGDSFGNWGIDDYCCENRNFLGRNAGYQRCLDLLLEIKPDMMVNPHWGPVPISSEYVKKTKDLLEQREKLYGRLFPHDNANFGTDPYWIHAYPYRQAALPGARVEIEARVMNHSARPMLARTELNVPRGWKVERTNLEIEIPARTEGRIRLGAITPSAPPRRRAVVGISANVNGKPLGEFAEAIVDFLS
jgi:glyoxylase-like metal-dependent hydrolase (beta-lactamase superfamily II)